MMSYGPFIHFIFILTLSGIWCQRAEEKIVEIGQAFSFDCKSGDSVYFGRRLGDWSSIQENDNKYPYLQLNFNALINENILRISSDSAHSEHSGYYACGQSKSMNRVYHLILAEVQSFYWTFICHGPAGSCARSDDQNDENLSTLEVADKTNVDLFCCASVTGYKNLNINMNQIGEIRGQIDIKRKQEYDGSWVICANQHTLLTRSSSSRNRQQTLTCELITDGRSYSSLTSVIVMKDVMEVDPDMEPPYVYTPPPKDGDFFNPQNPSNRGGRGKFTTGTKIAIIIGATITGLLLLGLIFCLIFFVCRKKPASKSTSKANKNSAVKTSGDQNLRGKKANDQEDEEEHIYMEPTPLYENAPTHFRL